MEYQKMIEDFIKDEFNKSIKSYCDEPEEDLIKERGKATGKTKRYTLNPIFTTEDDLKVALGAYINIELSKKSSDYYCHAELFKPKGNEGCDLSIHKHSSSDPYYTQEEINECAEAVIEIKYIGKLFTDSHIKSKVRDIEKDIVKLCAVKKTYPDKECYLVVFVECGAKCSSAFKTMKCDEELLKYAGEKAKDINVIFSNKIF